MLPELRAERQLAAIEAASVPYMKQEQHRELIDQLQGQLGERARAKPVTDAALSSMGIEVEYVSKGE